MRFINTFFFIFFIFAFLILRVTTATPKHGIGIFFKAYRLITPEYITGFFRWKTSGMYYPLNPFCKRLRWFGAHRVLHGTFQSYGSVSPTHFYCTFDKVEIPHGATLDVGGRSLRGLDVTLSESVIVKVLLHFTYHSTLTKQLR